MCSLVLLWHVLRAVGPEGLLWSACSVGVRLVGWRIFCAQVGAYFRVRLGSLVCVFVGARSCLCECILFTAAVCCVERIPGTAGVAGVRVYFWVRVRWVFGSSGVGAFCVRLWVYLVCYEVDSSPLFNFNRIFPPFSRSVPKPCAETSYLRVQCLCGRADVWRVRAVGTTILDVFG